MTRTADDYRAEHAELTRQIDEAAAAIPPEAREVVTKIDALISDKGSTLGALLDARRRLEEEFNVSKALEKERRAREEAEARHALSLGIVEDVEATLAAIEAFEAATEAMFDAFDEVMDGLQKASEKSKALSGQGRGFDRLEMTNRLSERFQALARSRLGSHRFGHMPVNGGSLYTGRERNMRSQEEAGLAHAVERALGA